MKIWTSYFGNLKKLPSSIIPISIALYPPPGWKGLTYPPLFPTPEILRKTKSGKLTIIEYCYSYVNDVLNKITPEQVKIDLEQLVGDQDVALVCYEKPEDFCHRKLVAAWIGGVKEWTDK